MAFDRETLKSAVGTLAGQGVYLGTSSWKYPGWRGQLYTEDRYIWHGKFSESRFERLCLGEYAEVFQSVCVDAAYYRFPDARFLEPLFSQVPTSFQFTFKVTDSITIKKYPDLPRFGHRAGLENEHFLDAQLFASSFLGPCERYRAQIGLLIFEFSHFSAADFARGRDFMDLLERFLAALPAGWRYGVEIRNRTFLHPEYFAMLARHGVAHIYSSWQDMPPLDEQLALLGSRTTEAFFGARLLLKPGRKYEEAVRQFKPYDRIQEEYPAGRAAGARLIEAGRAQAGRTLGYIYVNNRFEGNALHTIAAMIEQAGRT